MNGPSILKRALVIDFFNIKDSCSRSEFWWTFFWVQLIATVLLYGLYVLEDNIFAIEFPADSYFQIIEERSGQIIRGLLVPLLSLYLVIPFCTLSVRRWRDFGGKPIVGFSLCLSAQLLLWLAASQSFASLTNIPAFMAIFVFVYVYYFANASRPSKLESSPQKNLVNHKSKILQVLDTIEQGEGQFIEFKEVWQFDISEYEKNGRPVKNIDTQYGVIKSIAAFLNSDGGTVLIGVADNKKVVGLERDLTLFGNSEDSFLRQISAAIGSSIGLDKKFYYSVEWVTVKNKRVIKIFVRPNKNSKTWVEFKNKPETFFIRDGSRTVRLAGEVADRYWKTKDSAAS